MSDAQDLRRQLFRNDLSRRQLTLSSLSLAGAAAALPSASLSAAPPKHFSLEDRAGIQDLFTRYLWSYDCSDEQEFLDLFSSDAVVVGKGKFYQGRDEIRGWFRYLIGMRENEGDDIWMHEAGQFYFVPEEQSCNVYAYATHFNANLAKSYKGVRSLGYFAAQCVHSGHQWRFRRFSISAWDRTKLPWKKDLPWDELGKG